MKKEILRMENISKRFDGLVLLNNVNINVFEREIIALLGVNGAGKTMLMKILSGIYTKDTGNIYLNEKKVKINTPNDAKKLGIQFVYGDGRYIDKLSVVDNIFLGNEKHFFIKKSEQNERAKQLLKAVGLDIDPRYQYLNIDIAKKKLIEIATVLDTDPKLIIIDEVTSSFAEKEKEMIKETIFRLKEQGISIILITNDIKEAMSIADRMAVLRDGVSMGIYEGNMCNEQMLISHMVGEGFQEKKVIKPFSNEEVLRVENLNTEVLHDINITLYKGEILGMVGHPETSGISKLLDVLFGMRSKTSGNIYVKSNLVNIKQPSDAIKQKIGYVTDDIQKYGIIEGMSIRDNITLPSLKKVSYSSIIIKQMEKLLSFSYINKVFRDSLDIERPVETLSRGNKQKLVLCKWLSIVPDILLLDMSTISVDLNSKKEIYQMIKEFAAKGMSIILTSCEVEEVLAQSDRTIVLRDGMISGEIDYEEAKLSNVISLML